jgi:hypothetical protein
MRTIHSAAPSPIMKNRRIVAVAIVAFVPTARALEFHPVRTSPRARLLQRSAEQFFGCRTRPAVIRLDVFRWTEMGQPRWRQFRQGFTWID